MAVINLQVFEVVEQLAPLYMCAEWDNSGLQIGSASDKTDHILVALDVNEAVVKEAISLNAKLIISHHPILMKGIKSIDLENSTGALISMLIKNDITVYSAHTNLDSVRGGVSDLLADKLGLLNVGVLHKTGEQRYYKLVVFVPKGYQDTVRNAVCTAGAGWIGNYSDCTFQLEGLGTFCPKEGTKPFIGKQGQIERVNEVRLETIVPEDKLSLVVKKMIGAHPYEEVAYDMYPLKNAGCAYGFGRIGKLPRTFDFKEFIDFVKEKLNIPNIRAGGDMKKSINRVAVCGGSGSELWMEALKKGADVYLTGDIKYHVANDMLNQGLAFIDAGHFYTELPAVDLIFKHLKKWIEEENLEVELTISEQQKDPYDYF
ncbi:MAG: Nif3-like dinuclear metal center hexameric protein [Desulfotomaculum sp.]|jgi:dinuclear metal center YbgI/SA1388 family protein|nr:Nif3-like dinuclear metal center hexameric protein [Desulfotomaculum sp.]MCL0032963.1 Nif3-like dinuclear metal center hexameric protein [Peptococcaceae bacterium]MCL0077799.1 Nif3-like dinuclear metal center hexameric protein [Peptococcaceae bacterium]